MDLVREAILMDGAYEGTLTMQVLTSPDHVL